MDEGEGDGAKALDFDYDVLVVADAAGIACVAGKRAGRDPYVLAYLEIGFAINFTLGRGVFAGQQLEEIEFFSGNRLDVLTAGKSVYPKWHYATPLFMAFFFQTQCVLCICFDKQKTRNDEPR